MMKNTANLITSLRIPFAIIMLLMPVFSTAFWSCYLCAGLTDILDGIVARRLKQESEFGARLDSIADIIFACAIAAAMVISVSIPVWLWIWAALIALLRLTTYTIDYLKYHVFSPLHTYANKAAGGMIFTFPLLNAALGIYVSGVLLCVVAFLSAVEELLITLGAEKTDRARKSLFHPDTTSHGKS